MFMAEFKVISVFLILTFFFYEYRSLTYNDCSFSYMSDVRRLGFFWIEACGVMYSSSFYFLSYATGLFKSLRINLFFLFILVLSRSATAFGSFLIIFLLRFVSKITKFKMSKRVKNILSLSLIPLTIILLLKLIEIYYPAKSAMASTIFL